MKLVFISVCSSKVEWSESARLVYLEKINRFLPVETIEIKSSKLERSSQIQKKNEESKKIIEKLKPGDFVLLCDEQGVCLSSEKFAAKISDLMNRSTSRLVFIVGGAFGVTDEVKKIAQMRISLSSFVLNHFVAQLVLFEQVYRAFSIIHQQPYHNS